MINILVDILIATVVDSVITVIATSVGANWPLSSGVPGCFIRYYIMSRITAQYNTSSSSAPAAPADVLKKSFVYFVSGKKAKAGVSKRT